MGDQNGGFEGEIDLPGGSFSRLLLSPEDGDNQTAVVYSSPSHSHSHSHSKPPLFSSNTPKMLCFGDFGSETTHSTLTYSDDSSVSSSANTSNSHKRRNGSGRESGQRVGPATVVPTQAQSDQKNEKKKKNKPELGPTTTTNASSGHAKARREKLGERISVLQQLVCPYGKTDTASVLHEAMGYIRFLHDQVKVLCSPYLHRLPSSSPPHHLSNGTKERDSEKGLRTQGLCLVPVQCVVDVANNNGADFWSSATTTPSKP